MVLSFKWLLRTSNTPVSRLTSFNRQPEVLILVLKTPKNQKIFKNAWLTETKDIIEVKCSIISLPETNIALAP